MDNKPKDRSPEDILYAQCIDTFALILCEPEIADSVDNDSRKLAKSVYKQQLKVFNKYLPDMCCEEHTLKLILFAKHN